MAPSGSIRGGKGESKRQIARRLLEAAAVPS